MTKNCFLREIPAIYLARFNEGVNRTKPVTNPYGWGPSTIVNILKKREYLGYTINFKTRKHFKDKKSYYISENEWTIFEHTYEAIIDQQTIDLYKYAKEQGALNAEIGELQRIIAGYEQTRKSLSMNVITKPVERKNGIKTKSELGKSSYGKSVFIPVSQMPRQERKEP